VNKELLKLLLLLMVLISLRLLVLLLLLTSLLKCPRLDVGIALAVGEVGVVA
jgi:hypothetical protein